MEGGDEWLNTLSHKDRAQVLGVEGAKMWESWNSDWRLFMRGYDSGVMESRIKNLMTEEKENDIIRKNDVGRGKNQIEYYRKIEEKINFKPISDEKFNQLTIELKKEGVVIVRGDAQIEEHLKISGARASTLGKDAVLFREKVSVSDVLEEVYHVRQNIVGLNDDKSSELRELLNEIDAKKFLINNASKYNIPRQETEETLKHLKYYEAKLTDYYKNGGD